MSEAAAALLALSGDWAWQGWLVFLRVGAAMAFLPAFGEQSVPVRVKLAAALAFTAIVAPAVAPLPVAPPTDTGALAGIVLAETLNGLALGLAVRAFIWLLQIAGSIAANSTSLSQIAGVAVEPQPAIAQLLVVAGLALAAMAGLHVRIAEGLIVSYDTLPAGVLPVAGDLTAWSVNRVGRIFSLAFTFSAPFVIASLVYNLALGVINRAMPQLMVAFVGAPAITLGGLALLLVLVPIILPIWLQALNATLAAPFAVAP